MNIKRLNINSYFSAARFEEQPNAFILMKRYLSSVFLLFIACSAAYSKEPLDSLTTPAYYRYVFHSQRYLSLLTGYNFGKDDYGEIGLSLNTMKRKRSHTGGNAIYISDELKMRNKFIMGPKVGVWTGNGLAAGVSLIYYTDMESESCLRLRPEIGIGEHNWKLTYGYNIPLNNSSFAGVDKHIVSLSILWKVAKMGEHTVAKDWDPGGRKKWMNKKHRDSTASTGYAVVLAGVNGWTNAFGEVGIAYYSEEHKGNKGELSAMGYLSAEFRLTKETIIGPKLGLFVQSSSKIGLCGGASMIYYMGMHQSSLAGRPELGIHFGASRITYGYNHIFTNYSYDAIAPHNVSAIVGLKLGKGKVSYRVKTDSRDF
jgi:hypothetical protein